jgi:L-alanine-DL-glutamate epimerase-like enolase superfamily enzyme
VEGWGECHTGGDLGEGAAACKVLIDRGLKPRLIGENPLEYRKIWDRLYLAMEWYGRRGLALIALSGVDTALMDIAGKALHLPIHQLLGGKYRSEVPLYASAPLGKQALLL